MSCMRSVLIWDARHVGLKQMLSTNAPAMVAGLLRRE